METKNYLLDSGIPGTRLVVFGAIHGNETCGPEAIARVMKKIEQKEIALLKGSVCFVPVCNPKAYEARARMVEENLNRVFRKTDSPTSYEARLANELCALLDESADMQLDIHSTSAPGPISVFVDHPSPQNDAYARALGPEYILLDWPVVYANNPHGFESFCTSDYAHTIGIPGVTVECGQHDDPLTVDTAERAIIRALAFAGIVEPLTESLTTPRKIRMKSLEKKLGANDAFTKQWAHLERISKDTVVAKRETGEELQALEDCIMLLPKHHAKAGEEWFYLGVEA